MKFSCAGHLQMLNFGYIFTITLHSDDKIYTLLALEFLTHIKPTNKMEICSCSECKIYYAVFQSTGCELFTF